MHTHPFCDFRVTRLQVTRFFPVFQSGEKSCNAALTARVHWGFPTPPLQDGFGWHRLGSDQIRPEWGQRLAGRTQRGGDQAVWHRGASGPRRAARHGSTEGTGVAAVAARLGCRCGAVGELLCSGGLLRLWCHSPNRGETGQCGGRGIDIQRRAPHRPHGWPLEPARARRQSLPFLWTYRTLPKPLTERRAATLST